MSAPDVLAVMDDAIGEFSNPRMTDRHGTGPALREARAAVAELVESHARLLRLCESARLPKTADDMMPMVEARRIAANFAGGAK